MYQLNVEGARKANLKTGGFIDKSGDYKCKIETAFWTNSNQQDSQSKFLVIDFVVEGTEQKQTIELCYQKKDGTRNDFQADKIDGIMAALKLRSLTNKPRQLTRYDRVQGHDVTKNFECCPELEGKTIGILFQKEQDAYQDRNSGQWKEVKKTNIYAVYQAETGLTPSEILDRVTQPKELESLKASLESNPLYYSNNWKNSPFNGNNGGQQQQSGGYANAGKQAPLEDDSDLPF